jgi:chromate transporter
MIYFRLFISFLKIGAFSFGGGYAAIPLIEAEVVLYRQWITGLHFADIIAISQMTPGPVALNTATFIGYTVGGFPGAIIASASVVIIPTALVLTIAAVADRFFHTRWVRGALKGLRPALVALIAYSAFSLRATALATPIQYGVAVVAFILLLTTKIHPILIIFLSGAAGVVFL